MNRLETRKATSAAIDFLFNLHRQTFYSYVEQIWGWDEERRTTDFPKELSESPFTMVRYVGEDVDCISVMDAGEALDLNYIAILPDFQSKGLGTQLVRSLKNQAIAKEIPIQLRVLKVNPAKRLYERLGFKATVKNDVQPYRQWDND